jgi:hypothetical protein
VLRFQRPKAPRAFSKDVVAAKRAAKKRGEVPQLWRKESYRRAFVEAQRGKCGYCETYSLNHPAAIDHYAPKGNVHVLLEEGVEVPGLNNVPGRKTEELSATGYHWLALAWDNWLFACTCCNSSWKKTLFPIREEMALARQAETTYRLGGRAGVRAFLGQQKRWPPSPRRKVTPLLINPFGPEDPVNHLEFSKLGQVAPRHDSDHGRETIRTCGLHRESLRRAREYTAERAFAYVRRLTDALTGNDIDRARTAVEDLLLLGADKQVHAGMVRSIVLSQLGHRWPAVERLAEKLRRAKRAAQP